MKQGSKMYTSEYCIYQICFELSYALFHDILRYPIGLILVIFLNSDIADMIPLILLVLVTYVTIDIDTEFDIT